MDMTTLAEISAEWEEACRKERKRGGGTGMKVRLCGLIRGIGRVTLTEHEAQWFVDKLCEEIQVVGGEPQAKDVAAAAERVRYFVMLTELRNKMRRADAHLFLDIYRRNHPTGPIPGGIAATDRTDLYAHSGASFRT